MKYFLLLVTFISFSLYAQDDQVLLKNFKMLNEINGKTVNYKACASDDPNAPEYCKNLYSYVCAQRKITNGRSALDYNLTAKYWKTLPDPLTHRKLNEIARAAHQSAEDNVYKLSGLTRDEIKNAMSDVKKTFDEFISSTKLIKKQYKKVMVQKTANTNLVYGLDYVELLVEHAKKNNPQVGVEEIRTQAYKVYMSACGMNGLEVNAFFDGGRLVLCPGLIISASEYGRPKEEMLAALKFTIGHEIGHSIDAGVYPDIYKDMRKCYEEVTDNKNIWNGNMSTEITSDYWGALTLGKHLDPDDPEKNARIVALSVDGFCSTPIMAGSPHPVGAFRINQILAKHPYVARALNCAPASNDKPYCSINGAYTP